LRAIITSPTTLLLDEPFSALDYENQLRLRDVLQNYYLSSRATVLIVTHSIEEAVYLADEIVVLSQKPARVIGRVKNPLPRPRTIDAMKSKNFHSAKSEVLELFRRAASL